MGVAPSYKDLLTQSDFPTPKSPPFAPSAFELVLDTATPPPLPELVALVGAAVIDVGRDEVELRVAPGFATKVAEVGPAFRNQQKHHTKIEGTTNEPVM